MAQSKDELELLLLDDPESSAPIDTRAILTRIDNEEKIQQALQTLKQINCREKSKYALPIGSAATGFLSVGAALLYLYYIIRTPVSRTLIYKGLNETEQMEQLIREYNNTRIEPINSSCGIQFPLHGDAWDNVFTKPESWACFHRLKENASLTIFSTAYDVLCSRSYPLSNYCAWPESFDTTYNCFDWAMGLFNQSCYAYTDYPADAKSCADLTGALNRCPDFLVKYFNSHLKEKCGYLADVLCSRTAEYAFNATLPGLNVSCSDMFVSPEVFQTCQPAARHIYHPIVREDDIYEENWWTGQRIFWIVAFIMSLLLFIQSIFFIIKGTSWLNKKTNLNELPEEVQDELLEPYSYIVEAGDDFTLDGIPIDEALETFENAMGRLPGEKNIITDRCDAFTSRMNNRHSKVPKMPDEVVQKILFFSDLYSKPPIEDEELVEPYSYIVEANDNIKLQEVYIDKAVDESKLESYIDNQIIKARSNAFTSLMGKRHSSVPQLPDNVVQKILFFSDLYSEPGVEDMDDEQLDYSLA